DAAETCLTLEQFFPGCRGGNKSECRKYSSASSWLPLPLRYDHLPPHKTRPWFCRSGSFLVEANESPRWHRQRPMPLDRKQKFPRRRRFPSHGLQPYPRKTSRPRSDGPPTILPTAFSVVSDQ